MFFPPKNCHGSGLTVVRISTTERASRHLKSGIRQTGNEIEKSVNADCSLIPDNRPVSALQVKTAQFMRISEACAPAAADTSCAFRPQQRGTN
jgi:hypothetical protein